MHDGAPGSTTFPKIELHVHLEGTVRARTLLGIAKRNGVPLPADSVKGLAGFYKYRDFAHAEDPGLLRELAARGTVLDVCPISNLRTGVVGSLAEHPLPELAAAGIACSVSTDDPAMFATDLAADHAAAMKLGVTARDCYLAGQRGALCDAQTKRELLQVGDAFDWAGTGA
jgi:aminodeoxyfutalosine deaminase